MYFYVTHSAEVVKWLRRERDVVVRTIYNVVYFYVTHKLSLKYKMIEQEKEMWWLFI